jgi:hypothetical protein
MSINILRVVLNCQTTNKRLRKPKGQSKMDNPEKLATKRTQEEEKQDNQETQTALDTRCKLT